MILRSITKHVKDQNWFAVALDFFIVVVGILIAFQITNWSEGQSKKAGLARAEIALTDDLIQNYIGAKSHVAITKCRITAVKNIGARLMEDDDDWTAIAEGILDENWDSFKRFISLPKQTWAYRTWDSELARGSFDLMDPARRKDIDDIFAYVQLMERFGLESVLNEGRLTVLGQTTVLSRPERNRLFEILGEFDRQSSALGQIGRLIIRDTEALGLKLSPAQIEGLRDRITRIDQNRLEDFGECRELITTPFVESVEAVATP